MKKLLSIMLVIFLSFTLGGTHIYANESDVSELQQLIDTGYSITDPSSAEAFVWISNVLSYIEKHKDSYVYKDIKDEVTSAKSYSRISTFNKQNIILGYLEYLMSELNEADDKNVDELISDAGSINDFSGPQAYKWLIEVLKSMDHYKTYPVTQDIINEGRDAKGYSSTSTFNKFNIIVGYLLFLEDKIESSGQITVNKINMLINEANSMSDWSSSKAYKWLMNVIEFNQAFYETSVYDNLEDHCKDAKGNSSISTFNLNNIILADLMLLEQELPQTIVFEGIEISTPPKKTIYNEGDLFNTNGLSINALYTYIYSDDSSVEKKKAITDYSVDTTTPLSCDDNEWLISYTEGEVTKTVTQQITVNPVLISETLKSIEIGKTPYKTVYKEGETFSKNGMRIDAIYDQEWSDGTFSTVKKENVSYNVDTKTKLKASDTSVTIVVTDGDIKLSLEQGITVESYIMSTTLESIIIAKNPDKLSYNVGEKFDKTGMIVNAKYKCVWSNGYTEYVNKENIENYSVNTTSPLMAGTNKITVSFIDCGIKKTVDISINVVSQYKDEWINGRWYDEFGNSTYDGVLSWKNDSTGWWVEDSVGWYPKSQWQKIDGKWYYFCADGYMDYSEYRDGCWLNADGSMDPNYIGGHWCNDNKGWWYEDNGWYPRSQYVWIDGFHYWFGDDGYWS